MKNIDRKYIDWEKTGMSLEQLRRGNMELRRYVCYSLNYEKGECSGDCKNCKFEMDKSISRNELAQVFLVSESVITNWERGATPLSIEDLLLYSEITGLKPLDIVVFED